MVNKYASNNNIIFGAQTGSLRILKMINRSHSLEDLFNAVEISMKNKIIPHVDFIFGLPGEEKDDVEQTINVINILVSKAR
ncbi:MAG: radical SAM protein [Candidatus Micrarchaeota archaeon]|nr:radical SAM protein [Candidatus Micrarchaeota archaeon]